MKLSFFFPYYQISGVPVLFSNIINNIINDKSIEKIYTIDYENGALNKLCVDSPKLERKFFVDKKKILVPHDSILIMQSCIPYTLRDELLIEKNVKIFFWNLHPENLIPNYIPIKNLNNVIKANYKFFKKFIDFIFRSRLILVRQFIELCISKESLVFMDSTNFFNTLYKIGFSSNHNLEFLPVPVKDVNFFVNKRLSKNLSISWVGRVEGFKFYILKFILNKLSKYSKKNKLKLEFHLIGDGIKLDRIKKNNYENKFFKINFYGNISYSDLQKLLKNKINFSFAMGTSAMDSAKLGIPTILVDYSFKKISNYKFRWIFDTKSFDLAHDINNNNYNGPSYDLFQIMSQLDSNYDDLAKKSKNYVLKNHCLNDISIKFLEKVVKSELKYGEIDPKICKKSILRKLYYKFNNYYTGTK